MSGGTLVWRDSKSYALLPPRTTVSPPRSPGCRKRGRSTQPRPKDGGLHGLPGAAPVPMALAAAAAAAKDDAGLIPRAPSDSPSPHASTIRRTSRWKEQDVANTPRSGGPRNPSTTVSKSAVQSARLKRGAGGRNGGGAGCAGAVAMSFGCRRLRAEGSSATRRKTLAAAAKGPDGCIFVVLISFWSKSCIVCDWMMYACRPR